MIDILPAGPWKTRAEFEAMIAQFPQASWVQLDIVDGDFAGTEPSWYPARDETFPGSVSIEAHLMVKDPLPLAHSLLESGAERIIFHVESFATIADAHHALTEIATLGAEVGITLLLDTPLDEIAGLIPSATTTVQIMSIPRVGAQGVAFDDRSFEKIRELRARFGDLCIEVDGGVTLKQVPQLVSLGVRRLAVGSALCRATDPTQAYDDMMSVAQGALPVGHE
jgi:ribulose-phosphate 3-epimerase